MCLHYLVFPVIEPALFIEHCRVYIEFSYVMEHTAYYQLFYLFLGKSVFYADGSGEDRGVQTVCYHTLCTVLQLIQLLLYTAGGHKLSGYGQSYLM